MTSKPTKRPRLSCHRHELRGNASEYISKSTIQPGDRIVIVCRVSQIEQKRKRNHHDQANRLQTHVEENGGEVVGEILVCASGFDPF